jgi:putative transposase
MYDKLLPNKVYHIINRGINGEDLFVNPKDYEIFIKKLIQFTEPVAVVYAYCLMPNHFHILLKIKPLKLLPNRIKINGNDEDLPKKIMQPFSNFFNSYTRIFNLKYGRKDKLFSLPFKRIEIDKEGYFKYLIFYIHRNPVHHKFIYRLQEWEYSSYWDYINKEKYWFNTKAFEKYFDSKNDFKEKHHGIIEDFLGEDFILE